MLTVRDDDEGIYQAVIPVSFRGGEEEGALVHTFDLDYIDRHRAAWGFFRDRRTDLYGELVKGRPS